jgi:pimeloyl-ACP methyl ester carboxylesterase
MGNKKQFSATTVPITLQSQGAQLAGMLHKVDSRKIVILCHGFAGNKIEDKRLFVEAARDMSAFGYNVLRFDFYGAGDSDGAFEDTRVSLHIKNLQDAIDWAQHEDYEHIAVLGISLGAATAILTVSDQPVDALVTWSAVPDMNLLYKNHVNELLSFNGKIEYNGWLLHPDFFADAMQYDIKSALATLQMPKFIVQGTADEPLFVDGFAQFQDIVRPPTDFMEIPGASHTFQHPAHRRQLVRQTTRWLFRHF